MISIFDMKTLKKKSTVKCTSTPLDPPLKCQWKKNNLPPNSETLFKILQPPPPPIYFIEKFFGRQDTNGSEVRKW